MSQAGYTPIQLYYSATAAATPSAGNLAAGELAVNITDGKLFYKDNGGVVRVLATAAGSAGDVVGPGSSTDNALVRFDGTTGKLVQNSAGVLDDSGNLTGLAAVTMSGALTLNGGVANGVAYLNGSKVLTSGSALTFDGTTLALKNTANLADNYNAVSFSSDFTPSSLVDTNESGRVDFYNKSNNGTQQLGTSIQASAVTSTSTPTVVYGKLKLHAYYSASGAIQDTSYLELFANSTSTLRGNAGVDVRAGSSANSGKSLCFYTDDGDSEAYRITSAGTSIWSVSGSEQMRLTSTGLGIGTSSPFAKLQVVAASADYFNPQVMIGEASNSTGKQLHVGYNTTANTGYIQAVHNGTGYKDLLLQPNGGNLGLGVTPSAWASGWKAMQIGARSFVAQGGISDFVAGYNWYQAVGGTNTYIASTGANAYLMDGAHKWLTAPSGTAGNAISFTQAMTLDASGYLLVGATSSLGAGQSRFQLGSASSATSGSLLKSTNSALGLYASSTSSSYMTWASGTFMAFGEAPDNLGTFTERARIDSSGNLLVGTTSRFSTERLSVNQTIAGAQALYTKNLSGDFNFNCWNAATSGDNQFIQFITEASPTSRGSITYNRGAGLVAYNVTSDYRAKDIIGPVTDSGALIDSTPVYTGKMKGATQERPMFIAHETPAYAHTGEKDAVDAVGNPVYQQMDASALIPVMWAEIQSLRKRLAAAGI